MQSMLDSEVSRSSASTSTVAAEEEGPVRAAETGKVRVRATGAEDNGILDVVIVGAGLAGLSAAKALKGDGRENFVVLEASERVGGRTLDVKSPSGAAVVEMGGQWISPTHREVIALACELQVRTFDVYGEGKSTYHREGKNTQYGDTIACSLFAKLDLFMATKKLNRLAKSIPSSRPWTAKDALKYDRLSIGAWIESSLYTREGKAILNLAVQAVYGENGDLISLLDLLSSITSAGGDIDAILDDAQSMRIEGGPQNLSKGLAKRLDKGQLLYNQQVLLLRQTTAAEDNSPIVEVCTATNVFRCRAVILTPPRALVGRIRFDPPLPAKNTQLLQHQPMGSVIKINVIYSRPFWRDAGLNGAVVCSDADSPIQITYDNSPITSSEGVIVTFMSGQYGRKHFSSTSEHRKQLVLARLVAFFGAEATNPIAYHDTVWAANELALGAYGSYNPPGVLTAFQDTLSRTKVGPICFAGDGTSEKWQGYMEGAICSGQRAAREACDAL